MPRPGEAATRFDAAVLGQWKGLEDYLKSGWVNGLREDTITEGKTATGEAQDANPVRADA